MKKQIILFVLLLSLMTAGVFPLQNTIGYASESSGRKIVTIVFDDSFSMANEIATRMLIMRFRHLLHF